jgi:hypothetical protein
MVSGEDIGGEIGAGDITDMDLGAGIGPGDSHEDIFWGCCHGFFS